MTDSDGRWRTTTRRSALGLMSVGAAFFATETLGFTQLSADRGVNVAVADDDEAVIAVTGEEDSKDADPLSDFEGGDATNIDEGDPFTLEITNNSDEQLEDDDLIITIEVTDNEVDGDITIEADGNEDFNVNGENSFDFTDTDDGPGEFELDGTLGTGHSVTIKFEPVEGTDASNSLTFEFDFDIEINGTTLTFVREDIELEATDDILA